MNSLFQLQGWSKLNFAERNQFKPFFLDSQWLEIWKRPLISYVPPNGGNVGWMDSVVSYKRFFWKNKCSIYEKGFESGISVIHISNLRKSAVQGEFAPVVWFLSIFLPCLKHSPRPILQLVPVQMINDDL
jgi:hypothetical protein